MTVRSRLESVRRILATGVALRAIGYGVVAALSVAIIGALIDLRTALTMTTRDVLLVVAVLAFAAVTGTLIYRDRTVLSLARVALWVEEIEPSLGYRLVTAMETGTESLVAVGETHRWSWTALRRTARAVAPSVGAAIVAIVVMLLLPTGAATHETEPETAAPNRAEKSVASEKTLIMHADALQKKRASLAQGVFVNQSRSVAADQKRLRLKVGEIVFTQRSPAVVVNIPLLEAYNAMWEASNALEVGEPGRALPHMRRALAAMQKARTRRFAAIVELAAHDSYAFADSLQLLRVDALSDNPAFASALSDAVSAIRRGKPDDAARALARARQSLAGAPIVRDSIERWGVVP